MNSVHAIRTEALSKQYHPGLTAKPVDAVIDLDLEVSEGEVFAFIGLNGAGKTTTIKLLLDHARPTGGRAFLFGINAVNPRARRRVGYLPDLPYFYQFLTASEMLDYAGKLFGLSRSDRHSRAEKLLAQVGLSGHGDERLRVFSRGMLQRLGLAQALINDPELLILDEPLGGLDPVGRVELRNIIAGLKTEGRTVFFSSHILDDAQRIADRIGIIHLGRLIACGSLDELLTSEQDWEVEIGTERQDTAVEGNNKLSTAEGRQQEDESSRQRERYTIEKLCEEKGWSFDVKHDRITVIVPDDEGMREIYRLAAEGRISLMSVSRRRLNLEEAFLKEVNRWKH